MDALLKILRANGLDKDLPLSARTLSKTPRIVDIQSISNMDYHFGLQTMLDHILKKISQERLEMIDKLVLTLNIDVSPLFKSSNISAWSILCRVSSIIEGDVFPISMSVGPHKPSNLNFLNDTNRDLHEICQNGILVNGRNLPVSISCVICDAQQKLWLSTLNNFLDIVVGIVETKMVYTSVE